MMEIPSEQILEKSGDEEFFNENLALAQLLIDDVCFLNNAIFIPGEEDTKTVCCFVICNDIFAWGSADAEGITTEELRSLWDMHTKDKVWGSAKWCILKRKQMPQPPVLEAMKKAGTWDLDELVLEENWMDAYVQIQCVKSAQKVMEQKP